MVLVLPDEDVAMEIEQRLDSFDRERVVTAEGYWASPDDASLPFPVAHTQKWPGQDQFEVKLRRIEKEYDALGYSGGYFGSSSCRLCHQTLGSDEYNGEGMKWTGDFLGHYVMRHNVKPSRQFYTWVLERPMDAGTCAQRVVNHARRVAAVAERQRAAAEVARQERERTSHLSAREVRDEIQRDYDAHREQFLRQRYGDNWHRVDTSRPIAEYKEWEV